VDTKYDYLTPEFLNILLFQQKNLVIFPYLDFKHFHSLETFTIGFNTVDLDSTAIHNIIELLEHERYNCYSQNPTLFFINNLRKNQLEKILKLDSIRCVINANENVADLAQGNDFIFFNKKTKKFINYMPENENLDFENYLIKNSQNQSILQDKIVKIKSIATQIFTELNNDVDKSNLINILSEFDKKFWDKIIQFTENFFEIKVPNISRIQVSPPLEIHEENVKFLEEYEIIVKSNQYIGKEFIQALHEYRSKKVNPANLELEELYSPQQLYVYLRNHHWEQGIPDDFIEQWLKMNNTHYTLSESDKKDFLTIFSKLNMSYKKLNFPNELEDHSNTSEVKLHKEKEKKSNFENMKLKESIPPIEDFSQFREWIIKKMNQIECKLQSK